MCVLSRRLSINVVSYRNALVTDPYMRVVGAEGIFAIGDCSTIKPDSIHKRAKELFDK